MTHCRSPHTDPMKCHQNLGWKLAVLDSLYYDGRGRMSAVLPRNPGNIPHLQPVLGHRIFGYTVFRCDRLPRSITA